MRRTEKPAPWLLYKKRSLVARETRVPRTVLRAAERNCCGGLDASHLGVISYFTPPWAPLLNLLSTPPPQTCGTRDPPYTPPAASPLTRIPVLLGPVVDRRNRLRIVGHAFACLRSMAQFESEPESLLPGNKHKHHSESLPPKDVMQPFKLRAGY
ncbi:hypothetical protein DPEC_G00004000 [Dallia pectoralis]|uniref:Uncharacterized protein n=1 Tax=Dallia pectoralis TaxID=75939 RepID=A0ACC2HKB1_DALPE|nr:hypothetical protein DPEC_G00004000 [Dallia pectoralis]